MIKISLFKLITLSEYLPPSKRHTTNALALLLPKTTFYCAHVLSMRDLC